MALSSQYVNVGAYVPTTNIWDVSQLYSVEVTSPEFKELLVRLYQNINNISLALNLKDTGYYVLQEFVDSQSWFPLPGLTSSTSQQPDTRQNYRIVINFGALPAAGTKSVAHNLTIAPQWTFTRIYAVATNPNTRFIPIPYAAVNPADTLELSVDTTNVNITTGGTDYSAYTICYVILEYLKL